MAKWNDELKSWVEQNRSKYTSFSDIARAAGIHRVTFRDYVAGNIEDLERVSPAKRAQLYKLTKIESFKFPEIEQYLNAPIAAPHGVPVAIAQDESLRALARLEKGVSDVKRYLAKRYPDEIKRYTAEQRAESVTGLLEELALSLEPFRTGSADERTILIQKLKESGAENFVYITQMIDAFEKGEQSSQNWLRVIQPPHVIRKVFGGKK